MRWEMVKIKIKNLSLKYAKQKKTKLQNRELELESEILNLEKTIEGLGVINHEKEIIYENFKCKNTKLSRFPDTRQKD